MRIDTVRAALRAEMPAARGTAIADEVLERLARAGRFRDEETAEHVERVSRTCALVARGLGWQAVACGELRAAAAMHDIGKVGVPDAILRKAEPLTPEERPLIEAHAQIGYDILAGSSEPVLELAATIALTHHEWFDGSGYPQGLQGDEIPLAGRIAAVADVFDALTHDRVYRPAFQPRHALEILRAGRGAQFDPVVLDAFERFLPEVEAVRTLYPEARAERLGAQGAGHAPPAGRPTLSPREREVATLLATGMTGEQIAERLLISSETVRTHIRNAMNRLGVHTRAHLVARAITRGEIPSSPPEAHGT